MWVCKHMQQLDTMILLDAFRDDFSGVSGSKNTFYVQGPNLIQEKVYFYDFEPSV